MLTQGLGLGFCDIPKIAFENSNCNYNASLSVAIVSNDGSICIPPLKLDSSSCCGVRGRRSPFPDAFVNSGHRTSRIDHDFDSKPATCANVRTSIKCLLPNISRCEGLKTSIQDGMNSSSILTVETAVSISLGLQSGARKESLICDCSLYTICKQKYEKNQNVSLPHSSLPPAGLQTT